jgi:hypothetical protein
MPPDFARSDFFRLNFATEWTLADGWGFLEAKIEF